MKEIYKAFEETTTRNIKMILDHSNQTRKNVKDLENKVEQLNEQIRIQNEIIENLRKLLVNIQVRVYSAGT